MAVGDDRSKRHIDTCDPMPATTGPLSTALAAKLDPPGLLPTQVPRSAVCERICHAGAAKLVLVRAPAGFGKTTAMLQSRARFEADGVGTAWLTLDRADNDAPRFLAGLNEAAARIACDDGFDTADHAGTAAQAMEALARHPTPFVLFLDDFEFVQEPSVLGLVREIIDRLPRLGLLVIGSRALPDLRLGRLRARPARRGGCRAPAFQPRGSRQVFSLARHTAGAAAAGATARQDRGLGRGAVAGVRGARALRPRRRV
uniref:hypothetical protein n=1 Tax=Burkholderia alba TaxID=2683677 RepID=UPI002B0600DB|nr:hypothetical protein [Burkholderia alba]